MFAHFSQFTFVVGYTICDYRSTFDVNDKRNCPLLTEILPQKDHHRSMFFSLDSFSRKHVHSCGDKLLGKKKHYQKKLDFLCQMENARTDWKVIIFSVLVGLIIIILMVICFLAIYYCCCK